MKCIYLVNIVMDSNHIRAREPLYSEAGRLRAIEVLKILSQSSLFEHIDVVSQGPGKKRGWHRRKTVVTPPAKTTYLPFVCYGAIVRYLSTLSYTIAWLLVNVRKGDLVISYNFDPVKAIAIIATKPVLRFRLIIQYEELLGKLGFKYTIHRILERLGAMMTKHFIVSSDAMIEDLRLDHGRKRVVVSSGYTISSELLTLPEAPKDTTGVLTVLYAGRLDRVRGVQGLIEAFLSIRNPVKLVVTGCGPLEQYVESVAERHKSVIYLGMLPHDKFEQTIAQVDACINPQPTNRAFSASSFPSKVTNYLSHGKVVISTRVHSLLSSPYQDLIIFYDDEDVESLARAFTYVASNKHTLLLQAQRYPERVINVKEEEWNALQQLIESAVAN